MRGHTVASVPQSQSCQEVRAVESSTARTAACLPLARSTVMCIYGMPTRTLNSRSCRTVTGSTVWLSALTAHDWQPPAATTQSACGTSPAGKKSASCGPPSLRSRRCLQPGRYPAGLSFRRLHGPHLGFGPTVCANPATGCPRPAARSGQSLSPSVSLRVRTTRQSGTDGQGRFLFRGCGDRSRPWRCHGGQLLENVSSVNCLHDLLHKPVDPIVRPRHRQANVDDLPLLMEFHAP